MLCDLIVYRKEGKVIYDEAEWMNTGLVCYVTPEKTKSGYLIILTTLEGEYVTYAKNVNSFITAISKADGFVEVDRGRAANLNHDIVYNKSIGTLIYKGINYKTANYITIGKSYEVGVEKAWNRREVHT